MNILQLRWYAEQIYLDEKEEFEKQRDIAEYIASFWNPESVRKIQEARVSKESRTFQNDNEFEEQLKNREFKNNQYIDAILKIRSQRENPDTNNTDNKEVNYSGIKLPSNLKFLKDY